MKLVKLIANLGYGSRKQVALMFREGRITDPQGEVLYADDAVAHADVRVDGEPLDPPQGLLILLHKPVGYTCSTKDPGRVVYDLLPPRFRLRDPVLSTVGRLDRDTSGLLLMTDDGALLHRITSPKSQLSKVYEATLAQDGDTTVLTFVQHLDDSDTLGDSGPGWEYYLDMLVAIHTGGPTPDFDDYYPAQKAYYEGLT